MDTSLYLELGHLIVAMRARLFPDKARAFKRADTLCTYKAVSDTDKPQTNFTFDECFLYFVLDR